VNTISSSSKCRISSRRLASLEEHQIFSSLSAEGTRAEAHTLENLVTHLAKKNVFHVLVRPMTLHEWSPTRE